MRQRQRHFIEGLLEADGKTSSAGHVQGERVGCGHLLAGDSVGLRIGGIVGIGRIGIDGGIVGAALVKETEGHLDGALLLRRLALGFLPSVRAAVCTSFLGFAA